MRETISKIIIGFDSVDIPQFRKFLRYESESAENNYFRFCFQSSSFQPIRLLVDYSDPQPTHIAFFH